jgi:hypothetical protein
LTSGESRKVEERRGGDELLGCNLTAQRYHLIALTGAPGCKRRLFGKIEGERLSVKLLCEVARTGSKAKINKAWNLRV